MAEASLPRVPRGHEPATPLFARSHDYPQHDAKAVSTSYARKLASDFRLRAPRYAVTGCHRTPRQQPPFFAALNDVRYNEADGLGYDDETPSGLGMNHN